jgi:DHA1 family multidrug resistance protein-like MFS transporter
MAVFTSQTVGPVVGGLMAAAFGFRLTFALGGLMYIIPFLLIWLLVEEHFEPVAAADRGSYVESLREVMRVPSMLLLITVMFLVGSAAIFVRPVIPLVVDSFTDSAVTTKSGLVLAAVAVTSAVAAVGAGRVAERVGYRNALVVASLGAGIAYVPVAAANSLVTLMVLMAVVGVFSGAMIPMVNALIGASAPEGKHGSAFGLVGSAQALGLAVAPLAGGIVAKQLGIHAGFVIVGAMLACVSLLVILTVREPAAFVEERADRDETRAAAAAR